MPTHARRPSLRGIGSLDSMTMGDMPMTMRRKKSRKRKRSRKRGGRR